MHAYRNGGKSGLRRTVKGIRMDFWVLKGVVYICWGLVVAFAG